MAAIVWKGYVSFGLVSFPVRLYSAARPEAVHFHMLHRKDLSRVKEVWYCTEEDKPIQRSEMVKGYELKKGEYVVVEDDELKKLAPATATTMDVLQFIAEDEVDPVLFERSYYLAADEKVGKPYVLFLRALKETRRCAVAKLTMHGRENVVLIRVSDDGLALHTLFYADELHAANKQALPSKTNPTAKELDLAKTLVAKFSAPFKLDQFHDTYRDNVAKLIAQKNKGQKITPVEQPKRAPVVDLMEALKRSLEQSGTKARAAKEKPARKRARQAA